MRHVIVDVETTGLGVRGGGRVIEVGAVAVEGGEIVAEMGSLINSGAVISYGAYRVHNISAEMLRGQPEPKDVWSSFREFIGAAELVAHNAPFDSSFVRHELAILGHDLNNRWHCTLRLSRQHLPQLHNHKLDTVYRHLFGVMPPAIKRHRALDDARMTAHIWLALKGYLDPLRASGDFSGENARII